MIHKPFLLLMAMLLLAMVSAIRHGLVVATDNGLGSKPIMGWSSWSLQSTVHPGYGIPFLTAQNVKGQSDAMHQKLQSAGYTYINIDSGWWMSDAWTGGAVQGDEYDANGRPTPDPKRFPGGLVDVVSYINANGQHAGIYYVVGLPVAVFEANAPILGTTCHAADIALQPLRMTNGWHDHYAINYANRCAQAYINSIADLFAGWGFDFLKLDGVIDDNQADVHAWAFALRQTHRAIWLTLSWSLDPKLITFWKQNANAARIDGDVECYCETLVSWQNSVVKRFKDAARWAAFPDSGFKNELDSLDVGNQNGGGVPDGLSDDECQTYMTLWAISGANLLVGDDLRYLDSYGMALLTNSEVIAQDQSGKAAQPVSQATLQQVWWVHNADGSVTVALFNLDDTQAYRVEVKWSDIGLVGSVDVHDMWSHENLGSFDSSWGATLPPHGSRLVRLSPASGLLSRNF